MNGYLFCLIRELYKAYANRLLSGNETIPRLCNPKERKGTSRFSDGSVENVAPYFGALRFHRSHNTILLHTDNRLPYGAPRQRARFSPCKDRTQPVCVDMSPNAC
jgi:hypothetical protein